MPLHDVPQFKPSSQKKQRDFDASLPWTEVIFQVSKFFLWNEVEMHWKKKSQILFWMKMGFDSAVSSKSVCYHLGPEFSFKSEDQFLSSVQLSSPLSLFSYPIITSISSLALKVLL